MDHHSWRIWKEDRASVAEGLKQGEQFDAYASAFGENDLIIGFMIVEGFWDRLRDIEADLLKKENGYPPRTLNILWTLCELAQVGRIAHAGKVIGDQALLRIAGFQAEQIDSTMAKRKNQIDPETLSNHIARISEASVKGSWWKHVRLLRQKRWYRGGTYAVDAHEITIPYGMVENYEGAQKVGNKCGYKLVVIINVEPGQERIIAWALAGLAQSEKTLLKKLLTELTEQFGRLGDWMKLLLLDRGYWGAELLTELKYTHGVDYVTRAGNDELDMVEDIEGLLKMPKIQWYSRQEESSKYGQIRFKACAINQVEMRPSKPIPRGVCNVVVGDFFDINGQPLPDHDRCYYATSLFVNPQVAQSVFTIRDYYRQRWTIENQGFWVLTQRWNLDTLLSRSIHSIRARLNFVLQLYNIENCCAWKHPGSYDQELHHLRRPVTGERLGRPSIMVYSDKGIMGAFQAKEYTRLIKESIKHEIVKALRAGEDIEDVLNRI